MKYQISEVSGPLNVVSDICDVANRVIVGPNGGVILKLSSGKEMFFSQR